MVLGGAVGAVASYNLVQLRNLAAT
jgi:hypothetical protein